MVNSLDRASALPLWAQLVDRLTEAIQRGEFAEGFPTEHDLTARFAVSRHTVREAIRKLEDNGLVARQTAEWGPR